MTAAAVQAALEVAAEFGVTSTEPLLLQETNNTVLWLRPHAVVAKVAVRAHSQDDIRLEFAMATELAALGADTARPMPGARPVVHPGTGFVVTLWEHLEGSDRTPVPPGALAQSLRDLHGALTQTGVEVPSFQAMLAKARDALENDALTAPLAGADRDFLRATHDRGLVALENVRFDERRLHGEPHDGNRIATRDGVRWIDFESACTGPLEWDLAFQPREVVDHFPEADQGLLNLLRSLNSARVATWCLASQHSQMRQHGELHLRLLRQPSAQGWHPLDIP
ncbi:MAG TPA: phosphotransferase [Acidimicrobiales bacterium]|nr:phosphotransferase [Acidimicrobiales bacterium]